tara:strand:+ start:703 stop:936 length:234 start_codon:yes stop_codon:yes gene_type:complete
MNMEQARKMNNGQNWEQHLDATLQLAANGLCLGGDIRQYHEAKRRMDAVGSLIEALLNAPFDEDKDEAIKEYNEATQ